MPTADVAGSGQASAALQRILVVDDDPAILRLVKTKLESAGYDVLIADSGVDALEVIGRSGMPHLAIVDINMPLMNGFEFCEAVQQFSDLPVIMLSAQDEEDTIIKSLSNYAEDYITKPFSPRELVARLRALLRRAQPERAGGTVAVGDLKVDTLAREATWRGKALTLTPREFELLAFMAGRPGRVSTREELLRKVWGYDYVGETRTVDVHIRRLRAKLGARNGLIETVMGVGYKVARPPRPETP